MTAISVNVVGLFETVEAIPSVLACLSDTPAEEGEFCLMGREGALRDSLILAGGSALAGADKAAMARALGPFIRLSLQNQWSRLIVTAGQVAALLAAAMAEEAAAMHLDVVFTRMLGPRHAQELADHLALGGLLLWAETPTRDLQEKVTRILVLHGAVDVQVHVLPDLGLRGVSIH